MSFPLWIPFVSIGAQNVSEYEAEVSAQGKKPFHGSGNRLGDNSVTAAPQGPAQGRENSGNGDGERRVMEVRRFITFWEDGFSVRELPEEGEEVCGIYLGLRINGNRERFEKRSNVHDQTVQWWLTCVFQLGREGPLRRLDDPANQQFVQEINQGFAPRELVRSLPPGAKVAVDLIDNSSQKYRPPPPPKMKVW